MGARSTRSESSITWDFDELAKATGLSRSEIKKLYADYVQTAGRDGVIDKKEFIQLYSQLPIAQTQNPGTIKDEATRIFRAFDRDHNGTLSFDEFLNLSVMLNYQTPQNERLDFLIKENNDSEQEQVSIQYGLEIFRRLNGLYGLPSGTEYQSWKEVDQNNRGYVTHEDLINYINQQSIYNR